MSKHSVSQLLYRPGAPSCRRLGQLANSLAIGISPQLRVNTQVEIASKHLDNDESLGREGGNLEWKGNMAYEEGSGNRWI